MTLLNLSTAAAACALGALLISLRMRDRRRTQLSGMLFLTMLALMLMCLFPALEGVFGPLAILAAFGYAVPALFKVRSLVDWRRYRAAEKQ